MGDAPRASEVLEYRFDWHEVQVCGDFAFEWGYIIGSELNRETGAVTSEKFHVMRILQRQQNGHWKVHRTIWNATG
jgi:ketosteroid isomerase-like protein